MSVLALYIGKTGTLACGALQVDVVIIDAKRAWGTIRLLVSPIAGRGEQWVDESAVSGIRQS
jgi:hypothetical protein